MKRLLFSFFLLTAWIVLSAQVPAFPGAEGYARLTTTGGRGGMVYKVTHLRDDGSEGSLRKAIEASGPRIIVFEVSGVIELTRVLKISKGDLTIAGQTAPGDGITLGNHSLQLGDNLNNVIIRFIRSRMGNFATLDYLNRLPPNPTTTQKNNAPAEDAAWGRNGQNIILDHCSFSWCVDECGSFYDNRSFTMQWCILAESLKNGGHPKGNHGYGGIWGGKGASFHHNMLAYHDSRNPRFCGARYSNLPKEELIDFRNNVIAGWGANSGYAGEGGSYNMINNYYKPLSYSSNKSRIFQPNPDDGSNAQPKGVWGSFYVDGNYMYGSTAVTEDNWQGIHPSGLPATMTKEELKSITPFEAKPTTTHTAQEAFSKVLSYAGASLRRDAVDSRVTSQIRNGEGIILKTMSMVAYPTNMTTQPTDSDNDGIPNVWETDNGLNPNLASDAQDLKPGTNDSWLRVYMRTMYPTYTTTTAPIDRDNDGIADSWERANGLNPNDATDGVSPHSSGYTWVEVYLNSLVEHIVKGGNSDAQESIVEIYPDVEMSLSSLPESSVTVSRVAGSLMIEGLSGDTSIRLFTLSGAIIDHIYTQETDLSLPTIDQPLILTINNSGETRSFKLL